MQRLNTLAFLRGIADRFLPALFWMLVIFGFDAPSVGIITLIAAALHELGHITAIVLLGKRPRAPSGRLNGLKIRVGSCGYKELFLILFAGPLANLLFALLLWPFAWRSEYLSLVALINLATAISNLIPVEGYDGYGMIESLLYLFGRGTGALRTVSFIITSVFVFISLYMIGRFGVGYWVFFSFFVFFIKHIRKNGDFGA